MQFEPSLTPADLHVYIQHNCEDGNVRLLIRLRYITVPNFFNLQSDYLEAILQSEPGCPEETLDSLCGTYWNTLFVYQLIIRLIDID